VEDGAHLVDGHAARRTSATGESLGASSAKTNRLGSARSTNQPTNQATARSSGHPLVQRRDTDSETTDARRADGGTAAATRRGVHLPLKQPVYRLILLRPLLVAATASVGGGSDEMMLAVDVQRLLAENSNVYGRRVHRGFVRAE